LPPHGASSSRHSLLPNGSPAFATLYHRLACSTPDTFLRCFSSPPPSRPTLLLRGPLHPRYAPPLLRPPLLPLFAAAWLIDPSYCCLHLPCPGTRFVVQVLGIKARHTGSPVGNAIICVTRQLRSIAICGCASNSFVCPVVDLLLTHYSSFIHSLRREGLPPHSLPSLFPHVFPALALPLAGSQPPSPDGYSFERESRPRNLPDQPSLHALYTDNSGITRVESTDSSQISLAKKIIGPQKSSSELFLSRRLGDEFSQRLYQFSFLYSNGNHAGRGLGGCVPSIRAGSLSVRPRRPSATAASEVIWRGHGQRPA
jgi:hypothetical protein